MGAIHVTVKEHRDHDLTWVEREIEFCSVLNDCISFEKNLLVTRRFELLDKEEILANSDKPTIDIWTVDEMEWNDPRGTLALEMQLAFSLHRTDFWEDNTNLRVVAACKSVPSLETENGKYLAEIFRRRLMSLLVDIRVDAEVLVLPSVGAALLEETSLEPPRSLSQLEHCAELNASKLFHSNAFNDFSLLMMKLCFIFIFPVYIWLFQNEYIIFYLYLCIVKTVVAKHCSSTCVVFLPLPTPDLDGRTPSEYVNNIQVLTQNLPPCALVAAGERQEIITTRI